jgi:small subunit ribosomal protein S4
MGRYTGPVCRLCRREGKKLFLKGERCYMAKCPIERGKGTPGMQSSRWNKSSDYGQQFREKQQLKRYYGMTEGQFRRFFDNASGGSEITGDKLLQDLELRLDNVVYRIGFAASRPAARQFVLHKHVLVNGKKANVPSMVLKSGDTVEIKDQQKSKEYAKRSLDAAGGKRLPEWMGLDSEQLKAEIVKVPTSEEMEPLVDVQLVVELCSK